MLWDILFGTFKNPANFGTGDVGFESPADRRYGSMLVLSDVSDSVGTRIQARGERREASSLLAPGSG